MPIGLERTAHLFLFIFIFYFNVLPIAPRRGHLTEGKAHMVKNQLKNENRNIGYNVQQVAIFKNVLTPMKEQKSLAGNKIHRISQ